MLCDSCLHKMVCKEIDNFKKYEEQYIEMRKISSLFDKPIECPCHLESRDKDIKQDIKNLEVIKFYLKGYLNRAVGMSFMDIKAFTIIDELLENNIKRLKK